MSNNRRKYPNQISSQTQPIQPNSQTAHEVQPQPTPIQSIPVQQSQFANRSNGSPQSPIIPLEPIFSSQPVISQPNIQSPSQVSPSFQTPSSQPYPLVPCPVEFVRVTTRTFPQTSTVHSNCGLPLGLIIRPFAPVEIPVFPLDVDIPRCRGCRAYINPFVIFLDAGRKWKCNICTKINGVTQQYYSSLNASGLREDLSRRPELTNGAYEFITPVENQKALPIPPIYVFVVDVSLTSSTNSIPLIITDVISKTLDELVETSNMTQFCLITYDSRIHFYHFNKPNTASLLVHADVNNPQPPSGYKLLVRLRDHKQEIIKLLKDIPEIYVNTGETKSCYGSALEAGYEIISKYGGKIISFSAGGPTLGKHKINPIFDPNCLGTDKEIPLLNNQVESYKEFGLRCQKNCVTIDQFFYGHYNDIASLDTLCQLSGGQVYHYPMFSLHKDAATLGNNIRDNLLRQTGWNATLRLRCAEGIKPYKYYGHQFLRGVDLLGLATLDTDKSFTVELQLQEDLQKYGNASIGGGVCFQAAIIYGSSSREKRVRIFTIQCPFSAHLQNIYQAADVNAIVNVMAKGGVKDMLSSTFFEARERLIESLIKISTSYSKVTTVYGQLALPDTLKPLPLYILSLIKNTLMRTNPVINPDIRSAVISMVEIMGVEELALFLYPRLMLLSNMGEEYGLSDENGNILLPPLLNLNSSSLAFSDGVMLMDNGQQILLWISRNGGPNVEKIFGQSTVENINWNEITMDYDEELDPTCPYNRIANIITHLRSLQTHYVPLLIVNDNTKSAEPFVQSMIEDRTKDVFSYVEFIQKLNKLSMKK